MSGIKSSNIESINPHFLTDMKFWVHRIKYNTPFRYTFFLLWGFVQLTNLFLIFGIGPYLRSYMFLIDITLVVIFFIGFYLTDKLPIYFQDLIINNRHLFKTDENYIKYINFVEKTFRSKREFFIPLILGLLVLGLWLVTINFFRDVFRIAVWGDDIVYLTGYKSILNFVNVLMVTCIAIILPICIFSLLILITFTFKCINKLGTEEYPLNITYKDLKAGGFEHIGRLVIFLTIPIIILSTFLSSLGLLYIFAFKAFVPGFSAIIFGLGISSIMSLLLYKNTTHIHEAIQEFKRNLKMSLLEKVQSSLESPEVDFDNIEKIHNFYNEVDDINDWPYNPKSIKKLVMVLGSSVLPLVLSFFGFV